MKISVHSEGQTMSMGRASEVVIHRSIEKGGPGAIAGLALGAALGWPRHGKVHIADVTLNGYHNAYTNNLGFKEVFEAGLGGAAALTLIGALIGYLIMAARGVATPKIE